MESSNLLSRTTSAGAPPEPPVHVPDHELVRRIDGGSYGDVWLARNILGTFRAVKIVSRKAFEEARPFEREFAGLRKFEPISRTHPGFVAILHVGRDPAFEHFYCVMELADDVEAGQEIEPGSYRPKTLRSELKRGAKFSLNECVQVGLSLTAGLEHLHRHGLVHRDIKPSNIIFVNGAPKFADIGLVTEIQDDATFVGTPGFVPREGPGRPTADLFSLGMLLYELVMGRQAGEFPALPTNMAERTNLPQLCQFNEIILRACHENPEERFQTAQQMHNALAELVAPSPEPVEATLGSAAPPAAAPTSGNAALLPERTEGGHASVQVSILYKSGAQMDLRLLALLSRELSGAGYNVFFDRHLAIGVEWAREIEERIRRSDAVIILLSAESIPSEMIAYEVEIADQAAQQQGGRPRLLPVRIQYKGPLPSALASVLDSLHYFLWQSPEDDNRLVEELNRALASTLERKAPANRLRLESIGGAVPLDSRFYVQRETDKAFESALARRDSIVLIKGARQMGKTSLLARGLQKARGDGAQVVLTDFQKLNSSHLASLESFFLSLGDFLADQLDLKVLPEDVWDNRRSPNTNFERYLRREALAKIPAHFVWGLDEVDRLFTCSFGSEVFGLFRSWHNERALDPDGPWSRLTLAIAYATEAHLFITDVNQSPFNVGTRLALDDFRVEMIADLNERYGSPLRGPGEIRRFFSLVGGQPYLVRRGLNELANGNLSFADFASQADRDEGVFGDHLRRILVLLAKDTELTEIVRGILCGKATPGGTSFYRLRSAGVMAGDAPQQARPRCEIYASYLKRHLL